MAMFGGYGIRSDALLAADAASGSDIIQDTSIFAALHFLLVPHSVVILLY